jgi:phage FluMu protein Com
MNAGPYTASDLKPRCKGCGKLLAEKVTRPWEIRCVRCKVTNTSADRTIPVTTILEPNQTTV